MLPEDKMKKAIVWIFCILMGMIFFIYCGNKENISHEEKERVMKAAAVSAEKWLNLVDKADYRTSWNQAASYFKNAVAMEKWEQAMNAVRKPLGRLLNRAVTSKKYYTTLPGAPDGEYVVFQFRTSFENKKSCIETVTPMLDKDNEWRVSGYYIK
ncbi:MAG: DUF4019 domain-containing protein [Spirochaetes bacterium]|nr:DUF4019 domain-containing protein [Spirochaetota bacterium]